MEYLKFKLHGHNETDNFRIKDIKNTHKKNIIDIPYVTYKEKYIWKTQDTALIKKNLQLNIYTLPDSRKLPAPILKINKNHKKWKHSLH